MPVRLVHTADWQIGRRFERIPSDAGALLRAGRLSAVERIGELAVSRGADAVLVAGDVLEMNTVEDATLRRLLSVLGRFEVPWVLLPGNHDPALAESAWTRMTRMGLPPHVHLCTRPEPLLLCEGRLAVLPAPLRRRHETDDVTAWMDTAETPSGAVRVGLAHGSVKNRLPERSEAHNEIADNRAATARLDYLALGDWHGTLSIAERTWYAGTPEPDRFRDNDPGNVLWVEIDGPGAEPRVEKIHVGAFRFISLREDVSAGHEGLGARLSQLPEPHERCVLSLALSGSIDLAARREIDLLVESWGPRTHYLSVDDTALVARATEDDLDRIARAGFIADAMRRLRAIEQDPDHPDHPNAALALQILYLAHVEAGG